LLGLQEVDMSAQGLLLSQTAKAAPWIKSFTNALNDYGGFVVSFLLYFCIDNIIKHGNPDEVNSNFFKFAMTLQPDIMSTLVPSVFKRGSQSKIANAKFLLILFFYFML
jgi:hypothetical protein